MKATQNYKGLLATGQILMPCNNAAKATITLGLDDIHISQIQRIEKAVDEAIIKIDFFRTTSTKSGRFVEFNYKKGIKNENT